VAIDLGRGRRRAQAVQQEQVQILVDLPVACSLRFRAGAGRLGREAVPGAGAEAHDAPGDGVALECRLDAGHEALPELRHLGEGRVGQHPAERRAGGGERQRVARQRAADAAGVLVVGVLVSGDAIGELGRHAVGADRDAPADRLAERDGVGLESPGGGAAARDRR
jgi:hypothetical protein